MTYPFPPVWTQHELGSARFSLMDQSSPSSRSSNTFPCHRAHKIINGQRLFGRRRRNAVTTGAHSLPTHTHCKHTCDSSTFPLPPYMAGNIILLSTTSPSVHDSVRGCSLVSEQWIRGVSACRQCQWFPKIEPQEDVFLSKQTWWLLRNKEYKLHHSVSLCVWFEEEDGSLAAFIGSLFFFPPLIFH